MMLPENRILAHPGVILSGEFLKPLDIGQVALAAHLGISVQRENEIVRGKRGITPDTPRKLAQGFETTFAFNWAPCRAKGNYAKVYRGCRFQARVPRYQGLGVSSCSPECLPLGGLSVRTTRKRPIGPPRSASRNS